MKQVDGVVESRIKGRVEEEGVSTYSRKQHNNKDGMNECRRRRRRGKLQRGRSCGWLVWNAAGEGRSMTRKKEVARAKS